MSQQHQLGGPSEPGSTKCLSADPGERSFSLDLSKCSSKHTRIAVLGTSADPITDAHLKCACEIVHLRKAQEVWIVPCGERPDKPSLRTPYLHRLLMCHLAVNTTFGSSFPIRVCDEEMQDRQALSSIILMERLKARYPSKEFVFVIGADLVDSIQHWDIPGKKGSGAEWARTGQFLVMARPGYQLPQELPPNFDRLEAIEGTTLVTQVCSSSEMRRRLNFGDAERKEMEHGNFSMVDGLLTPAVLAHVIRFGLYRDFPPAEPAGAGVGAPSIAAAAEARGISPPPQ
jgi:nicotinate-nucleotide adenylyltransferase